MGGLHESNCLMVDEGTPSRDTWPNLGIRIIIINASSKVGEVIQQLSASLAFRSNEMFPGFGREQSLARDRVDLGEDAPWRHMARAQRVVQRPPLCMNTLSLSLSL